MKTLFLLFATLTVLLAKSQTSVYHPFPDSNATWNINMSQGMCYMGGFSSEDYSILIAGDTIIGNHTYHKLVTPFVQFSYSGGCIQQNSPGYKGAIRQDIDHKKVFYLPPAPATEQLLYDFGMEVGDTVKGYLEAFNSPPDIVTETDSVLVGENYHKRWLINPCYEIYLIEGIGSTYGLLQPSPGCATDMDYYSLSCFSQNGQSIYPENTAACPLITSTNQTDIPSPSARVFPNPSNGSFTIDWGIQQNISEVWLIDIVGNMVFREKITNQQSVSIVNLPGGVYLLNIVDTEKRAAIRKIIICL